MKKNNRNMIIGIIVGALFLLLLLRGCNTPSTTYIYGTGGGAPINNYYYPTATPYPTTTPYNPNPPTPTPTGAPAQVPACSGIIISDGLFAGLVCWSKATGECNSIGAILESYDLTGTCCTYLCSASPTMPTPIPSGCSGITVDSGLQSDCTSAAGVACNSMGKILATTLLIGTCCNYDCAIPSVPTPTLPPVMEIGRCTFENGQCSGANGEFEDYCRGDTLIHYKCNLLGNCVTEDIDCDTRYAMPLYCIFADRGIPAHCGELELL